MKIQQLKKTLTACLLIAGSWMTAQTPQWLFANNGASNADAYRFSTTSSMQVSNLSSGYVTNNMITDASGKRLFGIVDNEGYDDATGSGFGQMVFYETRVASPYVDAITPYGYTEKIVLPAPAQAGGIDCNRYYVIQSGAYYVRGWKSSGDTDGEIETRGQYEPYYSVVNMNTNKHFETLQTKTHGATTYNCTALPLLDMVPGLFSSGDVNNPPGYNFMGVSKLRSDNTYFLFFSFKETIYRFVVNHNSITYGGVVTTMTTAAGSYGMTGELEVYDLPSNQGYRLAVTHYPSNGTSTVFCCELTSSGVIKTSPAPATISLQGQSSSSYIHGLEFSPDGNYLYVAHETSGTPANPLEYCAFGATSLTPLPSAPVNKASFAKGHIEWNKENGIDYLYYASATELGRLAAPNAPALTTSWAVVANTSSGYANDLNLFYDDLHDNFEPYTGSYLLPDYIDREDYLAGYQSDVCCLNYKANFAIKEPITMPATVNGSSTYTVTAGNTYNCTTLSGTVAVAFTSTTTINGNVTIPNGTKVTFSNLRMEFSPNAALIVNANVTPGQQGGKVVLNATTLSVFDDCDPNAMWPGAVLNGIDGINQGTITSSQNAVLTTVGISQIDHALTAIKLDHGAIVQFTGTSKLLDNKVALEATQYNSPANPINDVSIFNNCIIKTQSTFTMQPLYFANIVNRAPTMRFINCTIINENVAHKNKYDGIISNNSATSLSTCNVSNLRYGVYHTNAYSAVMLKLISYGCTYTDNICGIYVGNCNYSSLNQNTFKILDAPAFATYGVGLYLDKSSRFIISRNTFSNTTYSSAVSPSLGTIGIVANNTNYNNNGINIIRQNTFLKLNEGIQNLNKNYVAGGSPVNDQGLRFYCNKFTAPISWCDIGVHTGAIDYHQGIAPDTAATNEFSHTTPIDFFYNTSGVNQSLYTLPGSSVDYKWHSGTTNGQPNVPASYPVATASLTTNANNCGGSPGARFIEMKSDPVAHLTHIKSLEQSIANIESQPSTTENSDKLALWKEERDQLQIQLVNYYLEDTTIVSGVDSALKYVLLFEQNTPHKGQLVGILLQQGKLDAAKEVYHSILKEQSGTNYQKMYGVLIHLYGKDVKEELISNKDLFQTITSIAADNSDVEAFLMAQSLLGILHLNTYKEQIMSMSKTISEESISETVRKNQNIYGLSNFPNPFTGSTNLKAFVPKGTSSANIVVVDVLGKEVVSYNLTEGDNTVVFDKQDVNGILFYTLFIDGLRKETKMMVKN